MEIKTDNPLYQGERELRNRILLRPIGLADYGWEMRDQDAWHFVAIDEEEPVACLLLYPVPDQNGQAQLMQMAVESRYQRNGIGRQLLDHALTKAKERDIIEVFCHARDDAVGFYTKLGFNLQGEPFEEVGIKHFRMTKTIE